jgi:hypothetical protein
MAEQDRNLEKLEEDRSVQCRVDLYRQLREQLLLEVDLYRRSGKEKLAEIILQSLE